MAYRVFSGFGICITWRVKKYPKFFFSFCHIFHHKIKLQSLLQPCPVKLTDSRLTKRPGHDDVMSGTRKSYCKFVWVDLNFCFGKGDIYLFTMPAVTRSTVVVRTINTILVTRVSWSDVTSHQSSIAQSTWLGVAEARFRGEEVAGSKNYFWDTYLHFMQIPKP